MLANIYAYRQASLGACWVTCMLKYQNAYLDACFSAWMFMYMSNYLSAVHDCKHIYCSCLMHMYIYACLVLCMLRCMNGIYMAKLRYFPNSSFRASPFVNKKTILRYFFAFFGSVNIEAVRSIFESETIKLKQFVHLNKKKFPLLIRYVLDLGEFWSKNFVSLCKKKFSLFSDSFRSDLEEFWSKKFVSLH